MFEAVAAHLLTNPGLLASFNPQQDISNLLLAFAKLEVEAPRLFEDVAAHLQGCWIDSMPRGFPTSSWPLQNSKSRHRSFFMSQ